MMLVVMTTVSFYAITVYTPTSYGKTVLHLSTTGQVPGRDGSALAPPVEFHLGCRSWAHWSDRIGRQANLVGVLRPDDMLTSYPALAWLVVAAPTFGNMLAVLLWLASFLYGSYNGAAMVVALTEIVPAPVRTAGFSLAYALATALFGGSRRWLSTWLIEAVSNNKAGARFVDRFRRRDADF